MKNWLFSLIVGLFCSATAWAQSPDSFSKTPPRRVTSNRIADVAPKSPFVQRYQPEVESFNRQRALDEQQQLMLDGTTAAKYPTQPASATQSAPALPPTHVVSPFATVPCDCEGPAQVPSRQWRRLLLEEQCLSARDMVPHYAYKAPYEGSYYFRPYMAEHIGKQADIVGGWRLDRANPYDNRFLQAIYDQPRQKMNE